MSDGDRVQRLARPDGNTVAYGDTTVSPGTTYSYTVKARDAAGNQRRVTRRVRIARRR